MFYANKVSFELQTKQNETNKLTKYCTCVPKQLSEMINSAIVGFTLFTFFMVGILLYEFVMLICVFLATQCKKKKSDTVGLDRDNSFPKTMAVATLKHKHSGSITDRNHTSFFLYLFFFFPSLHAWMMNRQISYFYM